MIKPLISDGLNESLNKLVGYAFLGNRLLDRMMSILSVKFVMNNSVKYLHTGFSHLYPLLADKISDYQGSRNNLTVYPLTPEASDDYVSPLDLFIKLYDYQAEYESAVKEVIEEADSENDEMTKKFLQNYLLELDKYMEQIILLHDKAEMYGNNWMDFDRDIEKFFIF